MFQGHLPSRRHIGKRDDPGDEVDSFRSRTRLDVFESTAVKLKVLRVNENITKSYINLNTNRLFRDIQLTFHASEKKQAQFIINTRAYLYTTRGKAYRAFIQQGKVDKSKEQDYNCRLELPRTGSITEEHKLLFYQSISIIITIGKIFNFWFKIMHPRAVHS